MERSNLREYTHMSTAAGHGEADSAEIVMRYFNTPIETADELYIFLTALTHEEIPFEKVCSNHSSPWDYVTAVYFHKYPKIIVVGDRTGGKTRQTAKLNAAELITKPKIEIASVGAIEAQTKRCYRYTNNWLSQKYIKNNLLVRSILEITQMNNGAQYEQLTGTLAGVNSPHPQSLRADEVELMQPSVIEDMKLVPKSNDLYRAVFVMISSKKFASGNIHQFLSKKDKMKLKPLIWCYKETTEPCLPERRGYKSKKFEIVPTGKTASERITAWEKCGECPLLRTCRGDLAYAPHNGFQKIIDLIDTFENVSESTWIRQKESGDAPAEGIVYGAEFDSVIHILSEDREIHPGWRTYLWVDWGHENAFCALVFQHYRDAVQDILYLIDEYYVAGKSTDEHAAAMAKKWGNIKFTRQFGDNSSPQLIKDFNKRYKNKEKGIKWHLRAGVKSKTVKEGVALFRNRLRSASGKIGGKKKSFRMNPCCVNTRFEFENYHYPEKNYFAPLGGANEEPADEFNNAMDNIKDFNYYLETKKEPNITVIRGA